MGNKKYASVSEYNALIKEWKKLSLKWQLSKNNVQKMALAGRINAISDKVTVMRGNLPPGTTFKNGDRQQREEEKELEGVHPDDAI